jgi:hypothetical protein
MHSEGSLLLRGMMDREVNHNLTNHLRLLKTRTYRDLRLARL